MPVYLDVVAATTETATKILARRSANYRVTTTTDGGRTASVSWSRSLNTVKLNMPALPPDAALTRAEADRLVAYVVHECCHVLHTDWQSWERAVAEGGRVRAWTNALEDVRIEAREIRAGHFPAMRALLGSLCTTKHFEALGQAKNAGFSIGQRVADAPYVVTILGRLANKYTIPTAQGLAGAQSAGVRQLTDHALAGVKRCKDSWDVLVLARELAAMEAAMAPPPPPPPPPPQDAPGEPQDDQDAPGEPQDDQDGSDAPGEPQDAPDGPDAPQDAPGAPDAPGEPQDGSDEAPAIEPDRQLDDMVQDIAKRAGIDDLAAHNREDLSHRLNTLRSTITDGTRNAHNTGYVRQASAAKLDTALPGSSVLHGQIARLLVSEEIRGRTHHEMSGRLDRRALVRMRAGAPDVYSQRDDQPGVDTAVLILIDGSSSMQIGVTDDLNRMDVARVAAWHIAKAAEMANAKIAIGSFVTRIAKRDGAQIIVVKPWDLPCADAAYGLLQLQADNYTPLSPAIIAGAGMLADVPATRRIMLVLTDGECDLGAEAVASACRLAGGMGVETVGIGMDCASVTAAFPPRYSVNVRDLAQLAATGLGVLVDMLEDATPRLAGAD